MLLWSFVVRAGQCKMSLELFPTVDTRAMTRSLNDLQVDVESTFVLLDLVRAGDARALDRLFSRYLAPLRHAYLSRDPAELLDTNDLVQDTLVASLKHIDTFQPQREGALLAYLRQAVVNRVRDEARRKARRPLAATLDEDLEGGDASPLDVAIGREAADRYETALQRLKPEEREVLIARVELGMSFDEVAAATGRPSGDAARKAVSRALLRLAEEMRDVA
jgi:RNA polymerase sigma-70 factor (ECF subfamily)